MKKYNLFFFLLLPAMLMAGEFDGVQLLAQRRVPWLAASLQFKKLTQPKEGFILSTAGHKVVIQATGPNAAAMALNWYLKYYCHRSMSHMGDNLAPVSPLPAISAPVKIDQPLQYRYALNYCTYNYTMSFYTWEDWERELDWMALNGVNLMLVANGSEAVWQQVLKRLGYTDTAINNYITGPAYNAWWLMGNIQGWGGPMPPSQIESRKKLVQKMLTRMRKLGIEPVMPAFYGMVPSDLKNITTARIIKQGTWGAFTRPDILDPTDDTAFNRIGGIFYEETKKLYGADLRFFSGDPFHEGGHTGGVDLGKAGAGIQQLMMKHFQGSIWVLQGWQDNPKTEMLTALDKSHILVQELFGEATNNWELRKGYEGSPFIWCIVNNFGERPGIFGKLQRYADETNRARNSEFAPYMQGVGIMPEGINNNPIAFEFTLELGWNKEKVDLEKWTERYVRSRYGKAHKDISAAWNVFLRTVYQSISSRQEGPPENILCARPSLQIKSVSSWGSVKKTYDIALFEKAVKLFAKAAPDMKNSRTYRIDLINFARQVIANEADTVHARMVTAFHAKDEQAFQQQTKRFLHLIDVTDTLLNTDPFFRLSTYQRQSLRAGNTKQEKENNLLNLMMLTTYWGENNPAEDYLHEYAYKEWSGLMSSFYRTRWVMYFDQLSKQMKGAGTEKIDFFHWERDWVKQHLTVPADPAPANLEKLCSRLLP
ncbi:alpha-N-acetylglucosaminidase [Paraflavitalea sp. CAU 1676]|uniref:alpha-N-acetylglucosaminidase n=1 Tax=Paraflavitalea sp. CAU 1676 TaxID=3032598 RepID=UPI0023DA7B69|nr:alpha-N-acetylglucosaminidase [Paraflavitalea sp. CAU 1676]MDF2190141.1 alpha-N-acetylglucosaminidase [Paraflavitalea sp. CAU 1676]